MKNTRSILYFLLLAAFMQRPSAWAQVNPPPGMVSISPGPFLMGDANDGESDAPQGTVTVSGFYIDTNLVNGSLWQEVYNYATNNGYSFDISSLIGEGVPVALGDNYPAAGIDWFDAVAWCNARSQLAGLTPVYYTDPGLTQVFMGGDNPNIYVNWATNGFRLPTEAEWEKAARGGLVGQRFPLGSTISETNANYDASPYNASAGSGFSYDKGPAGNNIWATNAPGAADTSPVGYYTPNGYGLYDMAGNLAQWCWDWYGATYYTNFPLTDPQGPTSGVDRVARNGGFNNFAYQCRTANRSPFPAFYEANDIGFRTVVAEIGIETVTVQANPTNEGSVTINGTSTSLAPFTNGASVSIMVTASNGFQLENWTSNGVTISEPATFVFTITTNVTLVANFEATNYIISLSASPSAGGTVTGNGTFLAGGMASIMATANPGYTFNDWTTNSVLVTASESYSFTVSNNEALVANFTPIDYSVTVNSSTNADGSVSGPSGSLAYGTVVTNTATPSPGFEFTDWTDNGTVVGTVTNYTYTVTTNATLVANFTPLDYTLTVIPYPVGFGTVSGGGTFAAGTSVTNTALTNGGYIFVNWTVNGSQVETSPTYVVTLNTNETVVANFNPPASGGTITLIGYPPAGGTVSGGGTIALGDMVTNTAIANPGYQFTNWTSNGIAVSTSTSYIFAVNNNEVLVGNFVLTNSTEVVIAYADAGGTVSSAGGIVPTGSSVTNTATASNGFVFANWTTNGVLASATTPYSFAASTNVALVANFTSTAFSNTVVAYAGPGGTVANVGGIFLTGSLVTNTATASNSFVFVNWTTNGAFASSTPTYIFTVATNVALVADFASSVVSYTVSVIANPSSEGSVSNVSGTYPAGGFVSDTATANSGFQFVNWTSNGVPESTAPGYTVTVTTNETVVANFAPVDYTVRVTTSPSNGPAANLSGTFPSGSVATLTAATNPGYGFVDWTLNGSFVTSSTNYPLTVSGNETLVANFTNLVVSYAVTVIANPSSEGSVSAGTGTYPTGSMVTNTETPDSGYQFVNWTLNGVPVSTSPSYTVAVTTNETVVANFAPVDYTVTVTTSPSNGPAGNLSGTFTSGSVATLTAATNLGYGFVDWTSNGTVVNSSANFPLTVTGNETLVANFTNSEITVTAIAAPVDEGSVSNAGETYAIGSQVTDLAIAGNGYQFANWTSNGIAAGSANPLAFTASTNVLLVANFSLVAGNDIVTVLANPGAGGTINGGGSFPTNSLSTNMATANPGYQFLNWAVNGSSVSTSNTYIFTVSNNETVLVANFAPIDYTVTVTTSPSNGPAANLSGTFTSGSVATLTAVTNWGYGFVDWTLNGTFVTSSASYPLTVNGDETLVANFTNSEIMVMAIAAPLGEGSVSNAGETFAIGSQVTELAMAGNGYQFTNWTSNGVAAGSANPLTFTASTNVVLVANFLSTVQTQAGNTVALNASAGGSVSGGGTFAAGTLVTNTEAPSNGFVFIGWTGAATGTGNPLVVAANSNMTITANFAATSGGLTLTVLPNGPGTVSPNLNGQILQTGGSYTLTATPDDVGSMFSGWTGSITTNTNPLTVTLGASMVLQANFTPNSFLSQQGTYNGLFIASNGVTAQTAGMLKGLAIGPTGTYSGALLIGGTTYPISGTFSTAGGATNQISRSLESGGPLTLAMTLSSSNNEPQVTGTVSGAGGVANLTAYAATLSRSSGEYTVLIPPYTNNAPPRSSPGGDSYLLITNDMGTARITGALADSTIFSQTTPVSQEGYVPIYATLYGSRGLLLGWINLDSITTNGVGLTWLSPKRPLGFYPSGFTNVLINQIMLSPWSNPPANLDLLTNVSRVGVINGSNGVNTAVSTSAAGSVTGTAVSGAINPKTGQFTVTFVNGKSVTTGHGAILLNSNIGGGYILTKTNAQAIQLLP